MGVIRKVRTSPLGRWESKAGGGDDGVLQDDAHAGQGEQLPEASHEQE